MITKKHLYHIHRSGNLDNIWYVNNQILIDDNFFSLYYKKILEEENTLIERYGKNYDIDYIIKAMEQIINKNLIKNNLKEDFYKLLYNYYFLRREKALEEGRKIFNPDAPCRFKSIFLSDKKDLCYWSNIFINDSLNIFLLELKGTIFMSSDEYFPHKNLDFDYQIEESKKYWNPETKNLKHKEFIFQGKVKILKQTKTDK